MRLVWIILTLGRPHADRTGYLLATAFSRALVDTTSHGWRPLFWFGAGPPVLIILFRLCLPETQAYRERKAVREANPNITKVFVSEGKVALKKHWILLIYMVLLMAGFNFVRAVLIFDLNLTLTLILDEPWLARLVPDYADEPVCCLS
jgi:MFS family permease